MQLILIFEIAILVLSVIIHEVSHGYVANYLGDPTARLAGRLTLNPLKHLDWLGSVVIPGLLILFGGFVFGWAKPVPYNPYNLRAGKWGPAYVAAAGPGANLLIALIFAVILRLNIFSVSALPLLSLIVLLNIMLAVFNLIPVAPLDGSKILFALIPYKYRGIEAWLERYQWIVIVVLLFVVLNTSILSYVVEAVYRLFVG